jgi:starch synthase
MSLTKVFFLSSEIEPFSNTYSLSNFSFDFGLEIKNNKDVDIRMCQPKYGYISERKYILREVIRLKDLAVDFAEGDKIANLKSAFIPKSRVQVYFAEGEDLFESVTDLLYKSKNGRLFNENSIRFAFFCKSVLFSLKKLFWAPEVIISNDWQTSFIPLLGKTIFNNDDFYKDIKYVHIVHSYNKNINLSKESFKSLSLLEEVGDNFDSFLNPVKYADFTVVLNDVNLPIIDEINKDSASKKVLKGAKHKVYDIDYKSENYKDQINNVIKDIRSL